MRVFCHWENTLMHNKRAFYDAWECFAVKTQTQTQHIFPLSAEVVTGLTTAAACFHKWDYQYYTCVDPAKGLQYL